MQLAFGAIGTKAWGASLLTLLSILLTGCANSCFSGFWNPPNGTIGVAVGNPPPACKLATPKAAIRIAVQVSDSCESCSRVNRVHAVVLSLSGIEFHASTNPAGESSSWQPVLPEPEKRPTQFGFLSERINALSFESTGKFSIPAGSYDRVRLRLNRDPTSVDDESLSGNACGEAVPNCVIMADGQFARLVFESDTLEFPLTSEATVGRLPFVMPDTDNELLIELKPVLLLARPFGEAMQSFFTLPGRAQLEPGPREKGPTALRLRYS